jgi:ABC-type phosphate transport system substrate-binding protein
MTRIQSLFAAVTVAAIAAMVPAANAQNVHFVAAGSSAQWQMAAIAADQLAINENSAAYGGAEAVQHWTGSNNAEVTDSRDGSIIQPEVGNPWLVWLQNGSGAVTDVWFAISVDSTVGVRTFSAQEDISGTQVSGGQIVITATAGTAGAGKINANLWPDNQADVPLTTAALNAIQNQHVNVGMTDIRPEDALFATKRALGKLNTSTYSGLGYVGPNANVGAPIYTAQGTGTEATPIGFGLAGKADPFNSVQKVSYTVPAYTTIPIGAAPIVFVMNHGTATAFPSDLATGVTPDKHVTGQTYPLANLFDGTTACTTTNPAFDASIGGTVSPANLTVILREPLSGTMNTTEFNLFRSFGNTDDSQEKGIVNAYNTPYNPLKLTCNGGGGQRQRAIGTGEVVNAVKADTNSIGYIFWGFGNAAKLAGATWNYLTLDGVDPLGLPSTLTPNQELPNCSTPTCAASLWTGSNSFPNLRNGTYKAWSIYRWLIANSNLGTDPYGFDAVAQAAQDYVDQDVADFVPFLTSTGSDGLSVYRSHFTQETIPGDNGSATAANSFNGGNALGGGAEAGGDVGGLVQGPFGITVPTTNGTGEVHTTLTLHKGYELLWKSGVHFTAGTSWEGSTITIGGNNYTIANVPLTTTILYTTTPVGTTNDAIYSFSAPFAYTYPAATTPGVLSKKQ